MSAMDHTANPTELPHGDRSGAFLVHCDRETDPDSCAPASGVSEHRGAGQSRIERMNTDPPPGGDGAQVSVTANTNDHDRVDGNAMSTMMSTDTSDDDCRPWETQQKRKAAKNKRRMTEGRAPAPPQGAPVTAQLAFSAAQSTDEH